MSSGALKYSQNTSSIFEIASMITEITGNQFSAKHQSMLENRLKRRCIDLKIDDIENYIEYFKKNKTEEIKHLVSLLTTHHTFFFREFSHFEFLEERALLDVIPIVRLRPDKKIKIWSAACSKGHEVYSLAMFLEVTLPKIAPDLSYEIFGTDIDHESVSFAKNGVYSRKEIKEIPLVYLADHWAKGTGEIADYAKVKNNIRSKTRWNEMNLLNIPSTFNDKFDIIFCRNVFIYFNSEQIEQSSRALLNCLLPHGYFFVGISESLTGKNLPIESVGPSIYRSNVYLKSLKAKEPAKVLEKDKTNQKTLSSSLSSSKQPLLSKPGLRNNPTPNDYKSVLQTATQKSASTSQSMGNTPNTAFVVKEVLRVVCVDDSPSIVTLLKKILSIEEGFEVVGVAINGLDAQTKIKELKPDVITLDIHMPEQTGIEYLMHNYNEKHPAVVMVSSVSREESELAIKALNLGASDYVEKPALNNLSDAGDEIRRKLRSAYRNKEFYKNKTSLTLDESFKKISEIKKPDQCLRFIYAQMSDKKRINELIKELGTKNQPPTFILIDAKNVDSNQMSKDFTFNTEFINEWPTQKPKSSQIYVSEASTLIEKLPKEFKNIPSSILVYGDVTNKTLLFFKDWKAAQILAEDLGPRRNTKNPLKSVATDVVPATSFAYMSCEYLGRKST